MASKDRRPKGSRSSVIVPDEPSPANQNQDSLPEPDTPFLAGPLPDEDTGKPLQPPVSALKGLYIVATPIGNLGDITLRALETLKAVDFVACEDTRQTAKLFSLLQISKPLLACHDHNEKERSHAIVSRLQAGETAALVSDAGTPLISDPGFRVVQECRRAGIPVTPVPGPCALAAALSASGLPVHQFWFGGFLPPRSAARRKALEPFRDASFSLVFYESCHRITSFAEDALAVLGPDRVICLAREVTKRYETFSILPIKGLIAFLSSTTVKGEYTVIIAPSDFSANYL